MPGRNWRAERESISTQLVGVFGASPVARALLSGGTVRRLLGLVAALTLTSAAVAHSSPPPTRSAVMLVRTGPGASSFTLTLSTSFHTGDYPAFFASFGGRWTGSQLVDLSGGTLAHEAEDARQVVIKNHDTTILGCDQIAPPCDGRGTAVSSVIYSDDGEADAPNRWFGIVEGKDAGIKFTGKGWTLRKINWKYRYASQDEATLSATAGARGLSLTQGTIKLPGGREGSIGIAGAACSNGHVPPVAVGYADVTLNGGRAPQHLSCPNTPAKSLVFDYAKARTDWTWEGTSVGDDSLLACRLFVLDLPKRL